MNRGTQWRQNNRERANAIARAWWDRERRKNPEKLRAKNRENRLKMKYGITQRDYEALLAKQGGHCALCDRTPNQERHGYLHVDHCHETRRVRGLLCENHNLALGKMGDTVEAMMDVLDYLRGTMT